ncbi:MAG: hypothetical protein ACI95C_002566 [Pseudohongiellaceae bacterium]|jgi:hypothetical protein
MKIIAVIQLDRWLKQFDVVQNKEALIAPITRIVRLYKQCHTIHAWTFSLTYDKSYSTQADELAKLGVELQPRDCFDPLTAFYELVTRCLSSSKVLNQETAIIRIDAGEMDPELELIDAMLKNHIEHSHHYSRNRGAQHHDDIEIMNFSVLREAWQEALLPDDRLQITPYIYRQQQRLNLGFYPRPANATLCA